MGAPACGCPAASAKTQHWQREDAGEAC